MKSIELMTFNIHSAIGRDRKVNVSRIAEVVAQADIVALQEVDNFWERSGNVSQLEFLKHELPHHFDAWNPNIDLFKHAKTRRQFGNLLFSRFPILSIKRYTLPKSAQPARLGLQCGVLEAIVAAPFGDIRVYATHVLSSDSKAQIRRLMEIYQTSIQEGPPISGSHDDDTWFEEPRLNAVPQMTILLGDLNIRPGSGEYKMI
ncbi:endonuclease/exonuclease/phosphatase family protein [Bradyrhizobium sp. SSUT77]|uniref:endonuclease/exonuclease/phosphatase family protein n=1 Tax=Bradyrhizobium sp. SSUT77 TaxID=3040603 RepID=UPI002448BD6B|nr:endonuclease/exonuclease/phosphatase family protein [Bradyrhizobium sp. SSUT77]MDH2347761.1 endonuclease/exonuclease/phosphatase family protein [Bradyrhizobium sp. SSUT77]